MSEKTSNGATGSGIGSRFRQARKDAGFRNSTHLAFVAGCTGSYISMLENEACTPSLRMAFVLEKLTGFGVSEWRDAFTLDTDPEALTAVPVVAGERA